MHRRQQLGAHGEALAAAHLRRQGMTVLHQNWRARVEDVRGELDLVGLDGDVLAIVEVRTRSSRRRGTAGASVGRAKRTRLRRLAAVYLAAHPHDGPVRGDVVTVDVAEDGSWDVVHLRGAW